MVQELIPGGDDELYTVGSYIAADGAVLGLFSGRKLRQSPPGIGTCRVGEAVWVQENVDAALRLLRAFDFHGVSQVEFKRDPRDGRFKLMEVNPRLWLWHGLAAALGVDFARIAYLDLLGRPPRAGDDRRQAAAAGRSRCSPGRAPAFQRPPYVEPVFSLDDLEAGRDAARPRGQGGAPLIPPSVERRARWVLDTLGARDLGIGDLPYSEKAWRDVEPDERPQGDDLAEAFFHLARDRGADGPARRARPLPRVRDAASIPSIRRSSACAGSSASSRRAGAAPASRSR